METPHQNIPHAVLSARVTCLEAEITAKDLEIKNLNSVILIRNNVLREREQEIRDLFLKIVSLVSHESMAEAKLPYTPPPKQRNPGPRDNP